MKNCRIFISLGCLLLSIVLSRAHAAACAAETAITEACECGTTTITSGFCVNAVAIPSCPDRTAATANCICGTGDTAIQMTSGRTCQGGLVLPVVPLTPAPTPSVADISGYTWTTPPQVLRTSQIFGGSTRQACGDQNYEVCVGPANKASDTSAPARVIKCFIPRNTTVCPTVLDTAHQCQEASQTPMADINVIPNCDHRLSPQPEYPRGCNCSLYGRSNDVRASAAICSSEMYARIRNASACRSGTRVVGDACDTYCIGLEDRHFSRAHQPAACAHITPAGPAPTPPVPAPAPAPAPQINCPADTMWNTVNNRCEPFATCQRGAVGNAHACMCDGVPLMEGGLCNAGVSLTGIPYCNFGDNTSRCRCASTILTSGGTCGSCQPGKERVGFNCYTPCTLGTTRVGTTSECRADAAEAYEDCNEGYVLSLAGVCIPDTSDAAAREGVCPMPPDSTPMDGGVCNL